MGIVLIPWFLTIAGITACVTLPPGKLCVNLKYKCYGDCHSKLLKKRDVSGISEQMHPALPLRSIGLTDALLVMRITLIKKTCFGPDCGIEPATTISNLN